MTDDRRNSARWSLRTTWRDPRAPQPRTRTAVVALTVAALALGATAACGSPAADAPRGTAGADDAPGVRTTATATDDRQAPTTSPPTSLPTPSRPTLPTDATVSLYGADVDAPGAAIPLVATMTGASAGEGVAFEIGVPGGSGACEGPQWRHATGVSQQCWITLPAGPGRVDVSVRGTLTSEAGVARPRPGHYAVTAAGPTAQAPDAAERKRIAHCGNDTDRVWLTFDDGFPSPSALHAVVDTLTASNVKGRFFATGTWARANPALVAEIRRQGHLLGNHTSDHAWLHRLDDAALRAQIAGGPTPDDPKLLRPGYGAGAFTDRVVDAAASLGQRVCFWTVDPRDWAGPTAEVIRSRILQGDEKTPPVAAGGIILLHMTGQHTAEALPLAIQGIRERGLSLEPLR